MSSVDTALRVSDGSTWDKRYFSPVGARRRMLTELMPPEGNAATRCSGCGRHAERSSSATCNIHGKLRSRGGNTKITPIAVAVHHINQPRIVLGMAL